MRTIDRATAFRRDYKQIKANPRHGKDLDAMVSIVVKLLCLDHDLPEQYRDHGPIGNWAGYRECQIKPDLLLIYRKPDATTLRLSRLGSHSDLFG